MRTLCEQHKQIVLGRSVISPPSLCCLPNTTCLPTQPVNTLAGSGPITCHTSCACSPCGLCSVSCIWLNTCSTICSTLPAGTSCSSAASSATQIPGLATCSSTHRCVPQDRSVSTCSRTPGLPCIAHHRLLLGAARCLVSTAAQYLGLSIPAAAATSHAKQLSRGVGLTTPFQQASAAASRNCPLNTFRH